MPKDWTAEIVAIGSELLLGQIVDTNTSYLAVRFQELGIEVRYSTQVGDDPRRMAEVLSRALKPLKNSFKRQPIRSGNGWGRSFLAKTKIPWKVPL